MAKELRRRYERLMIEAAPRVDFGIVVPAESRPGPRELPALVHGRVRLLRSRSIDRLVRSLDGLLSRLAEPADPDRIRLAGLTAVIRDGRATLVPTALVTRSTAIERACREYGARLADEARIGIALEMRAVVVSAVSGEAPSGDDWLDPGGTYAIDEIRLTSESVTPESTRAARVSRLISLVDERASTVTAEMLQSTADLEPLIGRPVDPSARGQSLADDLVGQPP